jgi:hypothetical protein
MKEKPNVNKNIKLMKERLPKEGEGKHQVNEDGP